MLATGLAGGRTRIDVERVAVNLRDARIPAEVSYTAGTFVCNHVFFVATRAAPDARVGFPHLPWADRQAPAGAPSLPADRPADALRIVVELGVPGGTMH